MLTATKISSKLFIGCVNTFVGCQTWFKYVNGATKCDDETCDNKYCSVSDKAKGKGWNAIALCIEGASYPFNRANFPVGRMCQRCCGCLN